MRTTQATRGDLMAQTAAERSAAAKKAAATRKANKEAANAQGSLENQDADGPVVRDQEAEHAQREADRQAQREEHNRRTAGGIA